jgi:ribonuclease BN (tRNA processing enzyme)
MSVVNSSRRRAIRRVAGLAGATALWRFAPAAALDSPIRAQTPEARAGGPGAQLVLLGTQGGPNFTDARGETASAVVVDGTTYLCDCGYGTLGALKRAGLNHRAIAQVFLTHLHDDHTADLPALLIRQWTDGRVDPTTVFGPHGTSRMVEAVIAFGEANATIRLVDEARTVPPATLLRGRNLQATTAPAEAYRDDRVTVRSIENTHFPDESKAKMPYRALSYRFDARNRSIVISGDTAYSKGLVELARGADVLVCEAIDVPAMRTAFDGMVAKGMYADNPEGIWRHIIETHTPVEDTGRMAAEARVGTLVLNHLVPGALGNLPDQTYIDSARKTFTGRIVVGRDQMVL